MTVRKFNENIDQYLSFEELIDIFTPLLDDASDESELEFCRMVIFNEDTKLRSKTDGIRTMNTNRLKALKFDSCLVCLDYSFVRYIEEEQNWALYNTTIDQYIKFTNSISDTLKFIENELSRYGYILTIDSLFAESYVLTLNIIKK